LGSDALVIKKTTREKSNDTGTEKKTGKTQDMDKGKGKNRWTPAGFVSNNIDFYL